MSIVGGVLYGVQYIVYGYQSTAELDRELPPLYISYGSYLPSLAGNYLSN
jgi:hypothetical protein